MIPAFLSHLKIYSGYPVPFTQVWIDGKPDFRAVDPVTRHYRLASRHNL
jgi:hypothetical protein